MQIFGGIWLTPYFHPNDLHPVEILPFILIGRGETLLIFVGKQDCVGLVHPPMNLYGVINKRDWNNFTTPREMTSRLDALALTVLQDKVARLTLEKGFCILTGWIIRSEPSIEAAFTKGGSSRWQTIPTMSLLSAVSLSSPHAWDKQDDKHQPSALLLKAIAMFIMDSTIKGYMIRGGNSSNIPGQRGR